MDLSMDFSKAPIKIYTWSYCPYCQAAKSLLEKNGYKYEEIVLDNKDKELNDLRQKTGHRTVPQIFLGDEFIGGYTDLKKLI